MKTGKIFAIFVLFLFIFSGCNETDTIHNSSGLNNSFAISAWNYSDNYYFVDTLYKKSFIEVMNDTTGVYSQSTSLNKIITDLPSFQVWVQCDNSVVLKKEAVAWILLPEKPNNGYDSIIYERKYNAVDTFFYGYFRELTTQEYYINPTAGFIGLKINIPDNYCIGITYRTYEGKTFGNCKYDVAYNKMMILKLIKCPSQSPSVTPRAWELKMKNVYRLPYNHISNSNFSLNVFINYNNTYLPNINGYKLTLSQMLLIDRYKGNILKWNPDGKFDYLEGRTIISETGDIIFPTLYPFRDALSKNVTDSNLVFGEIYEQSKVSVQTLPKANLYHIRGYTDTLK